jgi:hypothetical protein
MVAPAALAALGLVYGDSGTSPPPAVPISVTSDRHPSVETSATITAALLVSACAPAPCRLLPFGSHRGGNVALLVEILATLSGASFSMEAAPFDSGSSSPGIGVFLLSIDPAVFAGSVERLSRQFECLRREHQVRLPAFEVTSLPDSVEVSSDIRRRVEAAAHR